MFFYYVYTSILWYIVIPYFICLDVYVSNNVIFSVLSFFKRPSVGSFGWKNESFVVQLYYYHSYRRYCRTGDMTQWRHDTAQEMYCNSSFIRLWFYDNEVFCFENYCILVVYFMCRCIFSITLFQLAHLLRFRAYILNSLILIDWISRNLAMPLGHKIKP